MSLTLSPSAAVSIPRAARRAAIARWTGRAIAAVVCTMLAAGVVFGLSGAPAAVEGAAQMGFAPHHVRIMALVEACCLVLYLVPRTAPLGAVLLTGYFGGAVATHLRLDQALVGQVLVPVYVATLLWVSLWLRDARVRAVVDGMVSRR